MENIRDLLLLQERCYPFRFCWLQKAAISTGVVNTESSLLGQFFHLCVAEAVAAVPAHTAQDDLIEKVSPFEELISGQLWAGFETGASYPGTKSRFCNIAIDLTALSSLAGELS